MGSVHRVILVSLFVAGSAGCSAGSGGGSSGDSVPPTTLASPAGGTFDSEQTVSLLCDDEDSECAETHYTLDGSTPTSGSPLYAGPLTINADTTLRFFSEDTEGNLEEPVSAVYVIDMAPALTNCQIFWSNLGAGQERYDIYVVDMPIDLWSTGQKTYTLDVGDEVVALFYDEYDFANATYAARAITTSGTFDVTVGATSSGGLVTLDDPGSQQYFELASSGNVGLQVGSGGTATFDGNWSNPDPDVPPDPGAGSVSLSYMGSDLTIGVSFVNYAVCYGDAAFAPMSPTQRIEFQLARLARRSG